MSQPRPEQPDVVSVGGYLAVRLHQLGVGHLFGLPGDFNLALIDEMLATSALEWVGTTNELNAAYAADGYARVRGFGAVLTTFGVGELSAINGVAGSYAESVPVLQITGAPSTDLADSGSLVHHSLVDGDFGHFLRAYQEVTCSARAVTGRGAGSQIDRVLTAMLTRSRPGYLSIPADVAVARVPAWPLRVPLRAAPSDGDALEAFAHAVARRLGPAERVTVLAGHLARRRGLVDLIDRAASPGRASVASVLGGQGTGSPYVGCLTPDESTRRTVEESDLLVTAGVVFSDIPSGMFTQRIDPGASVVLDLTRATVGSSVFEQVDLADSLGVVVDLLCSGADRRPGRPARPRAEVVPAPPPAEEPARSEEPGPLTQRELWAALEAWIPPGTTVIADAGTAYYGAAGMHLAPGCELVGQPIWSSIGYTLPALLGTELADPGKRPVLVVGDGAAQLTVQELATILHRRLDVVVIVLANDGYTIERQIRSPEAVYQDITRWDWTGLPAALGHPGTATAVAADLSQLRQALALADVRSGPLVVEARLHRDDAPDLLTAIAHHLHRDDPADTARPEELPRSA